MNGELGARQYVIPVLRPAQDELACDRLSSGGSDLSGRRRWKAARSGCRGRKNC
jgi:hypothetical protein